MEKKRFNGEKIIKITSASATLLFASYYIHLGYSAHKEYNERAPIFLEEQAQKQCNLETDNNKEIVIYKSEIEKCKAKKLADPKWKSSNSLDTYLIKEITKAL